MDGTTGTVRQRWLQRAEAAYQRMFEGKSQEEMETLTQREEMALTMCEVPGHFFSARRSATTGDGGL